MKMQDLARPFPAKCGNRIGSLRADRAVIDLKDLPETNPDGAYYDIVAADGRTLGWVDARSLRYLADKHAAINLSPILDILEEGVIVVDRGGVIVYANEAYHRILDIPLNRIVGRNIEDVEPDTVLRHVLEDPRPVFRKDLLVKRLQKIANVRIHPLFNGGVLVGACSTFSDVTAINKLQDEIERVSGVSEEYLKLLESKRTLGELNLVSGNRAFIHLMKQAETVGKSDAPVLVRGENGSGKELIARLVQRSSDRRDKPFLTVNCAAIPENLMESELFGYSEGSFTGARKGGRKGKFQIADGGTLFLDEIGDMPLSMQSKLLRVLQEGEIEKLGSAETISVDVRIIAATNQPLERMIEEKRFREDLFYRLNVVPLHIPPLRERKEDKFILAHYFLDIFNRKNGRNLTMSQELVNCLLRYDWPGNVRELQNCISYMSILSPDPEISIEMLPPSVAKAVLGMAPEDGGGGMAATSDGLMDGKDLKTLMDEFESRVIKRALSRAANHTEAMHTLGMTRRTFYRKLKEHALLIGR